MNVIRPHGAATTYTIVLRFDSHENLKGWIDSETRQRLVQEVRSLLTAEEDFKLQTGLEYWFTPAHSKQPHAKPFKQFLVMLSAIFPLTIAVPWALRPLFESVPMLGTFFIARLLVAAIIVWLVVYANMRRYTRLVAAWLFR